MQLGFYGLPKDFTCPLPFCCCLPSPPPPQLGGLTRGGGGFVHLVQSLYATYGSAPSGWAAEAEKEVALHWRFAKKGGRFTGVSLAISTNLKAIPQRKPTDLKGHVQGFSTDFHIRVLWQP